MGIGSPSLSYSFLWFFAYVAISLNCCLAQNAMNSSAATPHNGVRLDSVTALRKTVAYITVTYVDGNTIKTEKGTSFFVAFPDSRLGPNLGFPYLVTNRHIIEPGYINGVHLKVLKCEISLNQRSEDGSEHATSVAVPPANWNNWIFPENGADDLAAMPVLIDFERYDIQVVPMNLFATRDSLKAQDISEGSSLVMIGYFYQFPGNVKMQPIVREGILALLPDEPMINPLKREASQYLMDAHVFSGNSGSPVFIPMSGMRSNSMMFSPTPYTLLGVASGFMNESSDNVLSAVPSTSENRGYGNSGIATIVPAESLRTLLESPIASQGRDQFLSRNPKASLP